MSNIFDSIRSYGGKWSEKSRRSFSEDEIGMIAKAQVVDSDYGLSCCFMLKNGMSSYIPMANDASCSVGDVIDISKAELVTLERAGNNDIQRISI